jgi:CBS domain-containing protein
MKKTGVHRMILTNKGDENEIHHLVTQSNLVEFCLLNLDCLHPSPDASLLELGLFGSSPVIYCDENDIMIDVISTMVRTPINAVPIRNAVAVIGVLSLSDLRLLNMDTFPDLLLSVRDFLKKHQVS